MKKAKPEYSNEAIKAAWQAAARRQAEERGPMPAHIAKALHERVLASRLAKQAAALAEEQSLLAQSRRHRFRADARPVGDEGLAHGKDG